MTVILYDVIGVLFFVIIFLLLIIVACTVCNVRSHKRNTAIKGKQNVMYKYYNNCYNIISANEAKHCTSTGPSLNDYNDQPTKSDNDALEMDAPGTKGSS
jgi:hypothetical protein